MDCSDGVCVFPPHSYVIYNRQLRTVLQILKRYQTDFINVKNVQWIKQEHDSSSRHQLLTSCQRVWNLTLHTSNGMSENKREQNEDPIYVPVLSPISGDVGRALSKL